MFRASAVYAILGIGLACVAPPGRAYTFEPRRSHSDITPQELVDHSDTRTLVTRRLVTLDTSAWVGQPVTIFMAFEPSSLRGPALPQRWRWRAGRGVFLSGDADEQARVRIFQGEISDSALEDVFTIEAETKTSAAEFSAVQMVFELEPAGTSVPVRLEQRSRELSDPDLSEASMTPEGPKSASQSMRLIHPTGQGVELLAEGRGYRFSLRPEWSEQNEFSLGGLLAASLWRGAAGVQFLLGAEKREFLVTGGWQMSPTRRLLVTAGQLQQELAMPFESGPASARMTQYAGGAEYQIATSGFLERLDLSVHGSRSASRELGAQVLLRRSAVEHTLVRVPLRVAGGSILGFEARGTVRPYSAATLSGQLGGERLRYDFAAGYELTNRVTIGAEWTQRLGSGFRVIARASSYAAQRTLGLEVSRSIARHQFGLTLTRILGRDGTPSDTQVRWQHAFTWGAQAPQPPAADIGGEVRGFDGRALLDLVSTRPAFMPLQVVARADTTVTPTRLIALNDAGLPPGARVDPATAAVTLPEVVTAILWLTRNGRPIENTGQFDVIDQRLEVRPGMMEVPAGTDTYVVTLENADSGVTTVTVTVSAGSVRIDRISVTTETRRDTPAVLVFATQTGVPLGTSVTSNTVRIDGINVPVSITVMDGEYAIDDGPFTTELVTVMNGQSVRVRHQSASTTATTRTTVLTVGATRGTFSSVTEADTVPETFSFGQLTTVEPDQNVLSDTVTIRGIDGSTAITVTGGEYSLNGGAFTTAAGTILSGQALQLRVRSASRYSATVTMSVTVGGIVATFAVTTTNEPPSQPPQETRPVPFSFISQSGVEPSTVVTSNAITVSGIDAPAAITVSGGEYAINGGAYTAATGTVSNTQTVTVRQTSSSSFSTTTTATLTIGGVSATFSVTTRAGDTQPGAFTFTSQTNVEPSTVMTSNTITVSGIDAPAAITVSGGEYAINGGTYTSATGTVSNGQTVTVRQTSSSSPSTTTTATLTIGGVSGTFSVTTRPPDTTPDAFTFTSQSNVATNTVIVSNTITVSGIEAATTISVSGGDYAINGGSYTNSAGTVANGQTVTVRQRSSNQLSTSSTMTLTIGGVSATFTVTTEAADTTPDAFSFTSQTGVTVNTTATSNTVTIAGINSDATVTVSGGEYSTQGNNFTSAAGTISAGGTLRLRQTSSASFSTTTTVTVTVGGVSATFSITTEAQDTTPDAFSFTSETNVNTNQTQTSNSITVSGINSPATISVSGAASSLYRINNGSYVSTPGTVVNGDTIRVRHTSASTNSTTTTTTLTIGGVSGTYSTTTRP